MTSSSDNFNSKPTPRIYVASLSDYNAGKLLGRWIDADRGAEHIWQEIKAMLASSKEMVAEEWAIHDFEGFGALRLEEYDSIDAVAELAEFTTEHGNVFPALVSHFGGLSQIEEAKQYLSDGYHGSFKSIEDYVEQFMDDCYGDVLSKLPDIIKYHIDYAGIAHDFELGGDIFTLDIDGELHVFSSNI